MDFKRQISYNLLVIIGVNEMQTLANAVGLREINGQTEINKVHVKRISTYFEKYKSTLQYQLMKIAALHINIVGPSFYEAPEVVMVSNNPSMGRDSKLVTRPGSTRAKPLPDLLSTKVLNTMDKYVTFSLSVIFCQSFLNHL